MGAYTNPDTFVDTQSGQHIREAIASVAASTVDVLEKRRKFIAEQQKKAQETKDKITSEQLSFYKDYSKNVGAPTDMDVTDCMVSAGNTIAAQKQKIESNKAADNRAELASLAAKEKNSLDVPKSFIQEGVISATNFKTAYEKLPGTEGALPLDGTLGNRAENFKKYSYQGKVQCSIGTKQVNSKMTFTDDTYTNARLTFTPSFLNGTDGKDTPPVEIDLSSTRDINSLHPSGEYTILNTQKDRQDIQMNNPDLFTVTKDKTGNFVSSKPNINKLIELGYGKVIEKESNSWIDQNDKELKVTKSKVFVLDRELLANDPKLLGNVGLKIGGWMDSDPRGAALHYNNILLAHDAGCEQIEDIDNVNKVRESFTAPVFSKYFVSDLFEGQNEFNVLNNLGTPAITVEKYVKPTSHGKSEAEKLAEQTAKARNKVVLDKEAKGKEYDALVSGGDSDLKGTLTVRGGKMYGVNPITKMPSKKEIKRAQYQNLK